MRIVEQNRVLLGEIGLLLSNLNLDTFVSKRSVINDATLGQHFRHIVEFYLCLIAHSPSGVVSYDDRERSMKLENSINFTLSMIEEIQTRLAAFKEDKPLVLAASYERQGEAKDVFNSSLKRELAYAMDHTIHHLAIIKIVLGLDGISVSENLGVAPSTVRFKDQKKSSNEVSI